MRNKTCKKCGFSIEKTLTEISDYCYDCSGAMDYNNNKTQYLDRRERRRKEKRRIKKAKRKL